MQLTNNDLNELVLELAGKEAVILVGEIKNKKNVSEFKLADKLKKTVNEVRNLLYRLHEYDIVHFIRKKDKKKGWYVYFWTFNHKLARNLLKEIKYKKINQLKEHINREKGVVYFACPKKCLRVTLENALDIDYTCPECGSLMVQEDNSKLIKDMEDKRSSLEQEIRTMSSEEAEKPKKKAKKSFKKLMKKKGKKLKKRVIKAKKKLKKKR